MSCATEKYVNIGLKEIILEKLLKNILRMKETNITKFFQYNK